MILASLEGQERPSAAAVRCARTPRLAGGRGVSVTGSASCLLCDPGLITAFHVGWVYPVSPHVPAGLRRSVPAPALARFQAGAMKALAQLPGFLAPGWCVQPGPLAEAAKHLGAVLQVNLQQFSCTLARKGSFVAKLEELGSVFGSARVSFLMSLNLALPRHGAE